MKRLFLLTALIVSLGILTLPLAAADLPVVRQPSDPVLSATDRAAMASAWVAIQDTLKVGFSPARFAHLQGLNWSDADFAQFAAGTLQAAGYTVLLATGSWTAGTTRAWILVAVPVSFGLAYVPVEAAPGLVTSSSVIGQIAWQDGAVGSSFDPRYLSFTQALAPAPNVPPSISLSIADRYVVAGRAATLVVTGGDPDDSVLAYVWTFDDGTEIADTRPIFWHTFEEVGRTTVFLRAIDARGAWTEVSVERDVLAEEPDCGCGG